MYIKKKTRPVREKQQNKYMTLNKETDQSTLNKNTYFPLPITLYARKRSRRASKCGIVEL